MRCPPRRGRRFPISRVLIIEDDVSIAEIERDFIVHSGHEAAIAADGEKGLAEAYSFSYDLILLDVQLPGIDGFEICKRIRSEVDIPIIMVTSKTEDIDKIRGFGFGADDYITKPFSLLELVARIDANLAQYKRLKSIAPAGRSYGELAIGDLLLNHNSRRAYVDGREIELRVKEFDLLSFLMTNPEVVFTREQLYEHVWGMDSSGDVRTVVVHINRLREKIESDPSKPVIIQTVWGAGYRFKI